MKFPGVRWRTGLLLAALLGAAALAALLALWGRHPRPSGLQHPFVTAPAALPDTTQPLHYSFWTAAPASDNWWITVVNIANRQVPRRLGSYLVSLRTGRVEGSGDVPLARDETDGVSLFSTDQPDPSANDVSAPVVSWLRRWGLVGRARSGAQRIQFWLFEDGTTRPRLVREALEGSIGYTQPSPRGDACIIRVYHNHFVIDMKSGRVTTLPETLSLDGGWWSDHEILYYTPTNDLALYDAKAASTRILIPAEALSGFLSAHGVRLRLGNPRITPVWSGDHFEFYLTSLEPENWLLRIDRENYQLQAVSDVFPSDPATQIDATGRYFVFSRQRHDLSGSGVYLRDAARATTTTLIPPTRVRPPRRNQLSGFPQFTSAPRFFGDKIVFQQHNAVWMMNMDGTNQRQIFPPPAGGTK